MERLTWKLPGRVWAADFTQADAPIDAAYPYILSLRDLASFYQLLSWPVRQADANATVCALTYPFAAYGPPLVLKTDNGSHFTEGHVGKLPSAPGVTVLLSPPNTPRYNGSEEAGIGSLKTRALHIAAAQGRADHWTCDDVEAARIEANRPDCCRPLFPCANENHEATDRAGIAVARMDTLARAHRHYQHRMVDASRWRRFL